MSDALFRPFFEATRDVFRLMLSIDDVQCRPAERDFPFEDSLSVSIGLLGDLEGRVIYRFPSATSLSIVSAMSGMDVDAVDDFVASAVSEIANIISGNVMSILAGENLTCDITPPALVTGAGDDSQYELMSESGIVTPLGGIRLDIMLRRA